LFETTPNLDNAVEHLVDVCCLHWTIVVWSYVLWTLSYATTSSTRWCVP
jgi:hypothetical protein